MANLPLEVPDRTITESLTNYGEVKNINEDLWARACRYPVSNGIRIVDMKIKHHLPSHMTIAGNRVLVSYEGQPSTYYGRNETGHQYQDCPRRKRVVPPDTVPSTSTWEVIVSQNTKDTHSDMSQQVTTKMHDTRSEGFHITVNKPSV
jgi:hypothetical protein